MILSQQLKMTRSSNGKSNPNDERYTPEKVWRPCLSMLGADKFDLDPATHEGSPIPCKAIYTRETNGLDKPWNAHSIWLNHPYSLNSEFTDKVISERSNYDHLFMLCKTDNSAKYFQKLLRYSDSMCFLNFRVPFHTPETIATGKKPVGGYFASTLFYFGSDVFSFYTFHKKLGYIHTP
jgi:hypothetical protein